jgi:hypothetical protein
VIANQQGVRIGGLMRCCLATLAQCEDEVEIGAVLGCMYEEPGDPKMRLANDGVWEWVGAARMNDRTLS